MEANIWYKMEIKQQILDALPYSHPFHFVEEITALTDSGLSGTYTLKEDEFFYQGHFEGNPITPGVIITEIAAQIGLVCLGLYLLIKDGKGTDFLPTFTEANVHFLKPVLPGTKLTVVSEKDYFRFNKLKCKVKVFDESNNLVCEGYLSGFITPKNK